METPVELAHVLAAPVPADQDEVIEEWGVYNDPTFYEPRFANGELHPMLRDKIEEPMWTSPVPGAAKRYMLWVNEQRAKQGSFLTEGWALLRMRTITKSALRTVTGEELESIEDGRRPNG
jgi:hypothetical protein